MKIVYFNYMWDLWGVSLGSTIKAIELLKALEKHNHDVKFYWRRDDIERRGSNGVHKPTFRDFMKKYLDRYLHEPNQLFKNISSIKEELAILEQEKPDLVISRMDSYVYSPVSLTQKTNIPFIIEVDSPSSYEKIVFQEYYRSTRKLLYWLEQKVLESSRAAFAQTNQVKNYYMEIGLPEDLFTVIPNGVDAERFRPDVDSSEVKDKFDLNGSLVIGFVGSFIYWHGVENLTTIMDNCVKSHSNVKFLMVGDGGPMKPYLEKYIQENKLSDKVILAGLVSHDEIPKYINAMDIVLAPYPKLDFFYYSPVKVFEYMACGKALITTDIGQISEIIQNGKTGLLTTPNDINAVIDNINTLIRDDNLRQKIGNSARLEIEKKHTWNIRGKQLSDLCEIHV